MLKTGINFNDQGFKTDSDTLMKLIREAGFEPRLRDQLYQPREYIATNRE